MNLLKYVHKLSWAAKSAQLWRHFIETRQAVFMLEWEKAIVSGSNGVIHSSLQSMKRDATIVHI